MDDLEEERNELLELAFKTIVEAPVDGIIDLSNELVREHPKKVADYFGKNPYEVMSDLEDFLEFSEYEDSILEKCLTFPEWIEQLNQENVRELYQKCLEANSLYEKVSVKLDAISHIIDCK